MTPKVYGIIGSPPVRAVLMCGRALNFELEFIDVNLFNGEHLQEDFLKKNPQRTVPVLEEDDGYVISESHAIMGYLVAKYGKDDLLYPQKDFKQKAIIDQRLHFDSGVLFARGLNISRPLLFEGIKPSAKALKKLKDSYEILEDIFAISKTQYVAGNNVTIADFSITTTITAWNCIIPYDDFPLIKGYVARMEKLPYYRTDDGLDQYEIFYNSKLNL